jgi:hypothetical protein
MIDNYSGGRFKFVGQASFEFTNPKTFVTNGEHEPQTLLRVRNLVLTIILGKQILKKDTKYNITHNNYKHLCVNIC